ncbi:hypothetical protein ACFSTE_13340 [Aquimarina hainanensis]|uniref:Uncharacterized protein n=1 Tax=Aquimarina hainanensis TaxID=1578017 RepID=A0ABW5N875_9FLAO
MIARFENVNSLKFSLNGVHYYKVFLSVYIDDRHINVVNVYDSKFVLLNATSVDRIEVNGTIYQDSKELIKVLSSVLYTKDTGGVAETITTLIKNENQATYTSEDGTKTVIPLGGETIDLVSKNTNIKDKAVQSGTLHDRFRDVYRNSGAWVKSSFSSVPNQTTPLTEINPTTNYYYLDTTDNGTRYRYLLIKNEWYASSNDVSFLLRESAGSYFKIVLTQYFGNDKDVYDRTLLNCIIKNDPEELISGYKAFPIHNSGAITINSGVLDAWVSQSIQSGKEVIPMSNVHNLYQYLSDMENRLLAKQNILKLSNSPVRSKTLHDRFTKAFKLIGEYANKEYHYSAANQVSFSPESPYGLWHKDATEIYFFVENAPSVPKLMPDSPNLLVKINAFIDFENENDPFATQLLEVIVSSSPISLVEGYTAYRVTYNKMIVGGDAKKKAHITASISGTITV